MGTLLADKVQRPCLLETEGAKLWSELRKLDPKAKRKDYFNGGVWEIEDLQSDLQLEREQAAKMMAEHATQESQEPPTTEEEEEDDEDEEEAEPVD